MEKLSRILRNIYTAIFLLMVGILAVMSAFRSAYFDADRDIETPMYKWDKPLLVIGFYLVVLYVTARIGRLLNSKKARKACIAAILFSLLLSLGFLFTLQSNPYMDCSVLVELATAFNKGDFSALNSPARNTYLYIYPFQIGYIAYLQILFRIFGEGNYFAVQVINAFFAAWMVWSLIKIAGELFASQERTGAEKTETEKDQIQFMTAILLIFCLPLFINITFVYGDVPGWSLAAAAFYCLLHWAGNHNQYHFLVVATILFACGYLLKTNIAVFIAAAVIIIILESLRNKMWKPLLFAALCAVLPILASAGVRNAYAKAAGIEEFPSGMPATCWIAMGMIEDETFENGWYNAYNIHTFEESGYDTKIADQMAKEVIRERISLFSHHPRYTAIFYLRKFISAWNDPEYDSQIKMCWGTRRNEYINPLARWLIWGAGSEILYWVMNLLHFVIFASCLAELVRTLKKKDDLSRMISYLILTTFGGMLFHLLWETQARYMIGYYCMLFPAAGAGIIHLSAKLRLIWEDKAGKSLAKANLRS